MTETVRVKNPAFAGKELRVGLKTYEADNAGIFDVPEDVGQLLLSMKGFFTPRITAEVRKASAVFRKAEAALKVAQEEYTAASRALSVAQHDADSGRGTEIEGPSKPVRKAATPAPSETANDPQGASEEDSEDEEDLEPDEDEDEDEDEGDEDDSDEDEESENPADIIAEMVEKGKGEEPSMRWTLDALIRYCRGVGIAASSTWAKADCIRELEANED